LGITGEEREEKGVEGRREGREGLSGNVAKEAFCLKSAPGPWLKQVLIGCWAQLSQDTLN